MQPDKLIEKTLLKKRIRAALAEAQSPYAHIAGGVYLERAWSKGADHMANEVLRLIDETPSAE